MLDVSKIESGKLELEVRPNDLHRLANGIVTTFVPNAAGKGLELTLDAEDTDIPLLMFDRVRVRQIIVNLMGNGVCVCVCMCVCGWCV